MSATDFCYRCQKGSSLFFRMVDVLDNEYKWCPACVYRLMEANKRYIEGPYKGDQDVADKAGYTKPPQVGLIDAQDEIR